MDNKLELPDDAVERARQVVQEWVAGLEYGSLPPGKISDLTNRIAAALSASPEQPENEESFLPWKERVTMLSINPDAATRHDIARMAAELSEKK